MTPLECPRETEVVAAVVARRWPNGCGDELRAHVRACAVCQEVVTVATAFEGDQDGEWAAAHVPSAAHVWWRTQIRARQEAERAVSRPLHIVQAFAAAAAIGLAIALLEVGANAGIWSVSDLMAAIGAWPRNAVSAMVSMAFASREAALVAAAVVACLLLMPLGVYFVLSEKTDLR